MTRALLVLTFAFALLAGCGGDDNGGGGDAPSKDDFVAEANKICREGEAKIGEVSEESKAKIDQATSAEEAQRAVADVLEEGAEAYDPFLDRLRDLETPEELSADWEKFLEGVDSAFGLIPELADATRDGDREKLEDLTKQFQDLADDTRPFAQTNGLDDCLPEGSTQ
jgi:chromosome segregation ATPase